MNTMVCFYVLVILAPSWILCDLAFKIKWHEGIVTGLRLRSLFGISLNECIKQCSKRSNCEYIVYNRRVTTCEIFGDFSSTTFQQEKGSLVIHRLDTRASALANPCFCKAGHVCNDGICAVEECTPPTILNGGFVGNRFVVGSSLKIICGHNYVEELGRTSITCEISGNWSYNPVCVPTIECSDISFDNGELVGTDNAVGATKSIACYNGFEEILGETKVLCESTGNWNYTPSCVTDCSVGRFFTGYSTIRVFSAKTDEISYSQAFQRCSTEGGALMKINETWKMDFVRNILLTCPTYNIHDFWVNGKEKNDVWLFSDSNLVPMSKTFWHSGEPSGGGDKCLRLKKMDGTFLFADKDCDDEYRFICEY